MGPRDTAADRPYDGLTDAQVLGRARVALQRAAALPADSTARAVQWAVFDAAMGELSGRAMAYILARIHEREKGDGK